MGGRALRAREQGHGWAKRYTRRRRLTRPAWRPRVRTRQASVPALRSREALYEVAGFYGVGTLVGRDRRVLVDRSYYGFAEQRVIAQDDLAGRGIADLLAGAPDLQTVADLDAGRDAHVEHQPAGFVGIGDEAVDGRVARRDLGDVLLHLGGELQNRLVHGLVHDRVVGVAFHGDAAHVSDVPLDALLDDLAVAFASRHHFGRVGAHQPCADLHARGDVVLGRHAAAAEAAEPGTAAARGLVLVIVMRDGSKDDGV